MKIKGILAIVILFVCGYAFGTFGPAPVGAGARPVLKPVSAASVPLYFIANGGQMDARALYCARTPAYTLWLTRDGLVFDRVESGENGARVRAVSRLVFRGVNGEAAVAAADQADYRVSYFYGRDETDWRTDIPTSRAVVYRDIYKGVDLKVYGTASAVEYDWVIAPGARPGQIRFGYEGARSSALDPEGNLVVETPAGRVVHRKPIAFQVVEGRRVDVAAAFGRAEGGDYGFELGPYDSALELVIDPLVLAYSTYLGGHDADYGLRVAVDPTGAAYVAGSTYSIDFPPASQSMPRKDIFVTKIAPDGASLVYSAFFPAGSYAEGLGLDVDARGFVYLAAFTSSNRFPLKNPFQSKYGGDYDGFVLKLAKSGKSLVYSSYIGGSSDDFCHAVRADASGAAFIGGVTESSAFPTTAGAFQRSFKGASDAFVAKVAPEGGRLVYSTLLGSRGRDSCTGLAVDAAGAITAVGMTTGAGFPLKSAFQKAFGGGERDAFVSRVSPSGAGLLFSSYLGGKSFDQALGIAMDADGAIYVVGETMGGFPVKGGFQKTQRGSYDAFVSKIAPGGKALAYSSYLGGSRYDYGYDIVVDAEGAAYIAGGTRSRNFPVKAPFQAAIKGTGDGFLTIVDPSGDSLLFSTFIGGMYQDGVYGIALDANGDIYLTGDTGSPDFPLSKPYQAAFHGKDDAFLLKLRK